MMNIVLIKSYTDKPWRSPETYRLIEDSLREKWPVTSINTKSPEALHRFFARSRHEHGGQVFAFNIAEYLDESNKTGFIPGLLSEWHIPHLGSDPETIRVGLDKARTKEILFKHDIPTPEFFVAGKVDSNIYKRSERIGYPLIVKPIAEGGHIGIGQDSIVYNDRSLGTAVQHILHTYHEAAIVEAFITVDEVREFSVGIIDCGDCLYTPIEIDFDAMDVEKSILSYESAQEDLERTKLVQDEKIRDEIIGLSMNAFRAVGAKDYSRVDLRMDNTGCYVLEINIMPGLGPHSFLPEAAKKIHGLAYHQLIQYLTECSLTRQSINHV